MTDDIPTVPEGVDPVSYAYGRGFEDATEKYTALIAEIETVAEQRGRDAERERYMPWMRHLAECAALGCLACRASAEALRVRLPRAHRDRNKEPKT